MRNLRYFRKDEAETNAAVKRLACWMAGRLAEQDRLTEAEMTEIGALFPRWKQGKEYAAGAVVRTEEGIFRLRTDGHGGKRPSKEGGGWDRVGGGN